MYTHIRQIIQTFSCLGIWQMRALELWCCGVLLAENCQLSAVASHLLSPKTPSLAALVKRLQRFLSNPRLKDHLLSQAWVTWIVSIYTSSHWVILVDETKLSDHLSVMMVGLAYRQRAIPLLWRCYTAKTYPEEGQVALIMQLLLALRAVVPPHIHMTVMADRGLGTSPALIRELIAHQFMFLLRVQGMTRLRLQTGQVHALSSLVKPGEAWSGRADVFKKAGWLALEVRIEWKMGEKTPWCLVSNCQQRQCADYRMRAWHEHSFRDLKSFGWQWNISQVWQPAHAHRLLFALAIAYTWVIAQAVAHTPEEVLSPSRTAPRQSIFRRGLVWLRRQLRLNPSLPPPCPICLPPAPPLLC